MKNISFNEYFEENQKYIYGACNNLYRQYKELFLVKGVGKDDLIQEVIIYLMEQWDKLDLTRGSVNTFVALKIKSCVSAIVLRVNAQKRSCELVYLDKVNDNFDESLESCIADENTISKTSDINDTINTLSLLIKNQVRAKVFRLYLQGYSYEYIQKNLESIGIHKRLDALRKDVMYAKKYIRDHYNEKDLEDILL